MIGILGKYLAIGADGTLSNDTWRYMRHIDRCYRIRTVAVPDEETEVRRLKRERSQHANFRGATGYPLRLPTAGYFWLS